MLLLSFRRVATDDYSLSSTRLRASLQSIQNHSQRLVRSERLINPSIPQALPSSPLHHLPDHPLTSTPVSWPYSHHPHLCLLTWVSHVPLSCSAICPSRNDTRRSKGTVYRYAPPTSPPHHQLVANRSPAIYFAIYLPFFSGPRTPDTG